MNEDEGFILLDGLESAFLGIDCDTMCPIYCRKEIIGVYMRRDAMSQEDAEEYFSFNCEPLGDDGRVRFVDRMTPEEAWAAWAS